MAGTSRHARARQERGRKLSKLNNSRLGSSKNPIGLSDCSEDEEVDINLSTVSSPGQTAEPGQAANAEAPTTWELGASGEVEQKVENTPTEPPLADVVESASGVAELADEYIDEGLAESVWREDDHLDTDTEDESDTCHDVLDLEGKRLYGYLDDGEDEHGMLQPVNVTEAPEREAATVLCGLETDWVEARRTLAKLFGKEEEPARKKQKIAKVQKEVVVYVSDDYL